VCRSGEGRDWRFRCDGTLDTLSGYLTHASYFFAAKKVGKKALGFHEPCNHRCTISHHIPRSLQPKPANTLWYFLCTSKGFGAVMARDRDNRETVAHTQKSILDDVAEQIIMQII